MEGFLVKTLVLEKKPRSDNLLSSFDDSTEKAVSEGAVDDYSKVESELNDLKYGDTDT